MDGQRGVSLRHRQHGASSSDRGNRRARSAVEGHIDQSAQVVTTGRGNLDAVRNWVTAAAASVPPNAAGEKKIILPIVQKGHSKVLQ